MKFLLLSLIGLVVGSQICTVSQNGSLATYKPKKGKCVCNESTKSYSSQNGCTCTNIGSVNPDAPGQECTCSNGETYSKSSGCPLSIQCPAQQCFSSSQGKCVTVCNQSTGAATFRGDCNNYDPSNPDCLCSSGTYNHLTGCGSSGSSSSILCPAQFAVRPGGSTCQRICTYNDYNPYLDTWGQSVTYKGDYNNINWSNPNYCQCGSSLRTYVHGTGCVLK